jgi:hypothetical protein
MSPTVYNQARQSKYRITLEVDALSDFNPADIDWNKLFGLDGSEHCEAYIEDFSNDLQSW